MENSIKLNNDTIKQQKIRKTLYIAIFALVFCSIMFVTAFASSASSDNISGAFTEIKDMITNLMKGNLGIIVSLVLIIVGCFAAVRTQSIFPFVVGFSMAIGFNYAPDIIEAILSDNLSDVSMLNVSALEGAFEAVIH